MVATFAIWSGMLKSAFKKGLEAAGPRVAGVETRVADVRLSPLSGRGEIENLFIGNPEGFRSPAAIEIGRTTVEARPTSFLSGKIVIRSVRVESPTVTYERKLNGSNLATIQKTLQDTLADGRERSSGGEPRRLQVDEFVIANGKVRAGLTALGGKGVVKSLPEIRLTGLGAEGKGLTPGELAEVVLREIVRESTGALGEAALDFGDAARKLGDQFDRARDRVKKTFGRD